MQETFLEDLEDVHAYINIKKSRIHKITCRYLVMSYTKVVECIITHMDCSHHVIRSESGSHLATYYGEDMQMYYKMLKSNEYANNSFYTRWTTLNTTNVIKKWSWELAKFSHRPLAVYPTKLLRDIYQHLIYSIFSDVWVQEHWAIPREVDIYAQSSGEPGKRF